MRHSYSFFVLYFILVALGLSCSGTGKDKHDLNNSSELPDSLFIQELMNRQRIGIKLLSTSSDTLEAISDGELTWRPFMETISINSLQRINDNIFEVSRSSEANLFTKGQGFTLYLKYDKSFIKLKLAEADSSANLISAKIENDKIQLAYGIRIGMSKRDFFSKIFTDPPVELFSRINVFRNFDPPGEFIEQSFVFERDTLVRIIMQAPYPEYSTGF